MVQTFAKTGRLKTKKPFLNKEAHLWQTFVSFSFKFTKIYGMMTKPVKIVNNLTGIEWQNGLLAYVAIHEK